MEPRLKETIIKEINPSLKEMFGYKSLYIIGVYNVVYVFSAL